MKENIMTFAEFYKREGYTPTGLKRKGLSREILENIFDDFERHRSLFENEARKIKDKISTFKGIHSATTRVKDSYDLYCNCSYY